MGSASFRFHAELNDFLSSKQAGQAITYRFERRPAIKDSIEAIGVPHTEVSVIMVNDRAVDFSYGLQDTDRVAVYPHTLRPAVARRYIQPFLPAGCPAFILDVHLGRLARYLRTAGFDTLYTTIDMGDERIAELADIENRVVLSRDSGLLKRSRVRYGYWLRNTQSRAQFRELVGHYHLRPWFNLFSRCPHCNDLLKPVDKQAVTSLLPGDVATDPTLVSFVQCPGCGQVYWQGSHYTHMQHFFDSV